MTTDPHALTLTEITAPERVDGPDARLFLELVRIGNEMCRHDAGHDYLTQDATEVLGFWRDTADWTHVGVAAERDGIVLGVAQLLFSTEDGTRTAQFDVMVDPPRWGEGAEEAHLAAVEEEAVNRGLTTLQTFTLHRPDDPGPRRESPTGFGAIPASDRQTVFMLEHGYRLGQVERNSSFDLRGPIGPLEQELADAQVAAGADYRLVVWTSPTPPEYLDSFAYVVSRMDTDQPQGELVWEQHAWDADRVRRRDERLRAQGMTVSVAAVQHVPSGELVAYNELVVGSDHTGATQQYGTLVVPEHRGHRLGRLIKAANLLRWRELVPESPRVSTFNAEENRPMLDINEALGFVPVSYSGAWQKELDPTP
ncbi:MAG: GNAT family N-acetyltransferase [Microbacterium sp.]|nr:GNAT family N-acetyltransferase [Microbacterium sp.]